MIKKIALLTSLISLVATTQISHAGSWRCVDDPNLPDCEEFLINEIEDTIDASWPSLLSVPLSPLPYSCWKPAGGGEEWGDLPITSKWTGDLRSFLIGRYNAAADVYGQVKLVGSGVLPNQWPNTGINYLFQEAGADVQAPGGSTGVRDLGAVMHQSTTGAFWTGNVDIMLHWLPEGSWTCVVGPPGYQVTKSKSGGAELTVRYPIAWLSPEYSLAEAVREQFRRAVRQVVTGTP